MILFGANSTTVLEYDLLHDGQAQSRAAVAPRKVWLKQPPKVFRFDSLPPVRHFRTHEATLDIMSGRDRDVTLVNREQRLDRIIDQVYEDAFDLFDVKHHR